MKVICAWCKKVLQERTEPDGVKPEETELASHGICPDCAAKVRAEEGLC